MWSFETLLPFDTNTPAPLSSDEAALATVHMATAFRRAAVRGLTRQVYVTHVTVCVTNPSGACVALTLCKSGRNLCDPHCVTNPSGACVALTLCKSGRNLCDDSPLCDNFEWSLCGIDSV
jgi:hypothetical protein